MTTMAPESSAPSELPPELEPYPAFAQAVSHYHQEQVDYSHMLADHIRTAAPDGYIEASANRIPESAVASPHIAVAFLLSRLGAPVVLVQEADAAPIAIFVDTAISDAYSELWSQIFPGNARYLANDISQGLLTAHDAMPQGFHVAPVVNRHILWAHDQQILDRAFVTSKIVQYINHGSGPEDIQSVSDDLAAVETLITEGNVHPLALETVLAMGASDALRTLNSDHDIAKHLQINPTKLPTIEQSKLELKGDSFLQAFDSYWAPVTGDKKDPQS